MSVVTNFLLSFSFSFIGSIPPATINLTVIQLGLDKKLNIAWRLAIAAAIIEYFYAWLAVKFESFITSTPVVVDNFQLITAIVMITLGTINLLSANKTSSFSQKFNQSGFRRGLILGILNPLAMPFWIGVTAYLESQHWINLATNFQLHSYLVGVSLGGLALLLAAAYLAQKIISRFEQNTVIKKFPGVVMLALGIFSLIKYLL
jgi:threonine/homoserine/homoserine lactone efflux protein